MNQNCLLTKSSASELYELFYIQSPDRTKSSENSLFASPPQGLKIETLIRLTINEILFVTYLTTENMIKETAKALPERIPGEIYSNVKKCKRSISSC